MAPPPFLQSSFLHPDSPFTQTLCEYNFEVLVVFSFPASFYFDFTTLTKLIEFRLKDYFNQKNENVVIIFSLHADGESGGSRLV